MKKVIQSIFLPTIAILLITFSSCKTEKSTTGIVTDIDGNVYNIVTIGTQRWLQENLQTSHYNNGAAIMEIEDSSTWVSLYINQSQTPAWCYYNESPSYNVPFGKIYNWYAATDSRGLCPVGWHVPTTAEWLTLSNFLGGDALSGGHLKSTSSLWVAPNSGADNSSGFTALPGGNRFDTGQFTNIGNIGNFWASDGPNGGFNAVYSNYPNLNRGNADKYFGNSVRCIGN